jgi:hypothetical protein
MDYDLSRGDRREQSQWPLLMTPSALAFDRAPSPSPDRHLTALELLKLGRQFAQAKNAPCKHCDIGILAVAESRPHSQASSVSRL